MPVMNSRQSSALCGKSKFEARARLAYLLWTRSLTLTIGASFSLAAPHLWRFVATVR